MALWPSLIFGLVTGSEVADRTYLGTGLVILAGVVLFAILLVRRRHIEPEPAPA